MNINKEQEEIISTLRQFQGISIVGGGRSGRAAVKLVHALGLPLTLHEKNFSALPTDFKEFITKNKIRVIDGEHQEEHFQSCDLLIPSPGVPISLLTNFLPKNKKVSVMAETELASLFCKHIKMLAITGTSGKTTTTSLCAKMLETQGLAVFLGGNIGIPLSEYVLSQIAPNYLLPTEVCKKADVLVLELSSFQLQNCTTLKPDVAICLNIAENHLDYHADMDEYIASKMQIFANQNGEDFAILGESLKELATKYKLKSKIIYYDDQSKNFTETRLMGQHNQGNAEAAWQACKNLGLSFENAKLAVKYFVPLPHRLEFIADVNKVSYYNDSKCTTVEALKTDLLAVLESERPICLLAGGKFKGGNLKEVAELMRGKIKHIALFGASRENFEEAFSTYSLSYDKTMQEAILRLQDIVLENDVVLLAPATSSFDQYTGYEQRGQDFTNIVLNLKAGG